MKQKVGIEKYTKACKGVDDEGRWLVSSKINVSGLRTRRWGRKKVRSVGFHGAACKYGFILGGGDCRKCGGPFGSHGKSARP